MTCIAGLIQDDKIYIGGDAAFDTGTGIIRSKNPKVYKKGEFIFGVSGYLSVMHALTHVMVFPPCYEYQDPFEYIVNNFVPSYRSALHELGLIELDNGVERNRSEVLVGFRGHLFNIGTDFSVLESYDNFYSVGSGALYAMGALHATKDLKLKPHDRVLRALEAASEYDECVLRPFEVEVLDDLVNSLVDKANSMMAED